MALKEFKDYPNTDTPINTTNMNYNFNDLNNKLGKVDILSETIKTKTVTTLNGNVNNYDFILVFATSNAYEHRQICNIYRYNMRSDYVQLLQLDPEHWENNFKLYDNKCDTSNCQYIGTDSSHITAIIGIKI